jgi:hypothetical protein
MWHLAVLEDDGGYAYLLRSSDPWARVEALNGASATFSVEKTFDGAGIYESVLKTRLRDFRDAGFRDHRGLSRYLCTSQRIVQIASALLPDGYQTEVSERVPAAAADLRAQTLRERARSLLEQADLLDARVRATQEGSTGEAPRLARSESEEELWLRHLNWSAW